MTDELTGKIVSTIHSKEGFHILAFRTDAGQVKVKGFLHGLPRIRQGLPLALRGEWVEHKTYGRQFNIKDWSPWATTPRDAEEFLQATCLDKDSDDRRQAIYAMVDRFGPGIVNTSDPVDTLLDALPEHRRQWARDVLYKLRSMRTFRELALLLGSRGFKADALHAIRGRLGDEAADLIRGDPYRLLDVPDIEFSKVDALALDLGVPHYDLRRLCGAIMYSLREKLRQGDLYVRRADLAEAVTKAVRWEDPPCDDALDRLVARSSVRVVDGYGVYLPYAYEYENASAKYLAERLSQPPVDFGDIDAFLQEFGKISGFELAEDQAQAVRKLSGGRLLVLTGRPGTGKTSLVKAFVRLFVQSGLKCRLMAPTGIAAKRLASVVGHDASTIHRALGYDGGWSYGAANQLSADAVIVDEASMMDQELLFRLLDAIPKETVLVLVGDDAQLPAVGPGMVMTELLSCPDLPHVTLTKIYRQVEGSSIVANAHRINRGEMPLAGDATSEFRVISVPDDTRLAGLIVDIAAKLKSVNANFQILSPMYDGAVGVDALNSAIRDRLNPLNGQGEVEVGNTTFRVGDRLMVIQNDYELGVYNGDVGKLLSVGKTLLSIRIHNFNLDGTDSVVNFPIQGAVERLRLAYAVTVHKCQGMEFDTIIMPVVRAQGRMLQRNLLYTAVTRARKRVWLLGDESAVSRAVGNDRVVYRNTRLGALVSEHCRCMSEAS